MAHDDLSLLIEKVATAKQRVDVGQRYFHYKSPDKFYIVKEIALIEETQEVAVVYEAEYAPGIVWIRPLENFLQTVEIDGKQVPRFTKI